MRPVIRAWDRLARNLFSIRPARDGGVLGYALRRYPGRGMVTVGGATLRRGDLVLELHLDSRLLAAETADESTHHRILRLRRTLLADLRALARQVESDPRLGRAAGLWALTVLHRGVGALGFTVAEPRPVPFGRLSTWYMRLLLAAYHPDGNRRLQQRRPELVAREIFLPMAEFRARYGGKQA
ncbi:MAG: hypothetical protein AB2385_06370 [Symbiobacterium sp.]|mgnify:CR=1 FL=1|uniref:YkoP family protein n=1 Tax=Symbiobacterium sp. TaxID=1971213 RepID=UPI003464A753